MKNHFFSPLKNNTIVDILQVGLIDIEDGIAEFIPVHTYLFIEFEKGMLKLQSIEQYSKLRLQYVDALQFEFDIDEDMIPAKMSVAELVLTDTMAANSIKCVDIYGARETADDLICDALSFHLTCGQEVFFDPTYIFGINIGGERQKMAWLNNFPNSPSNKIQKQSVNMDL